MIGQRIKEIRHNNNLTQEELAQGIISRTYLSLIEKGNVQPSTNVLIKLSERLNCTVDDFLNDISNFEHHDVEILKELSYQEYQLKEGNYEVVGHFIEKNILSVQHLPPEDRGRIHAIYGHYFNAIGKKVDANKHLTDAIGLLSTVPIHQNYIDVTLLKIELDIIEENFEAALDTLDSLHKELIKFDWNAADLIRVYFNYSLTYFNLNQHFTAYRYYNKFESLQEQFDFTYKQDESRTLVYKILYKLDDTEMLHQRSQHDERTIGHLFTAYYYFARGNIFRSKELFEGLPKEDDDISSDKLTKEIFDFLNERLLMI